MPKPPTLNQYSDESELFRSVRQGSREAFTLIYQKYHKMLYVLAYQYLKDIDKAEDAVQNAFTKLWEFHSDLTVTVNLKNYLYTMTKNSILNQIRNETNALINNYKIVQDAGEYDDSFAESMDREELMSIFSQAIENLPEQKRIVCQYKLEEKLSNQEIADKMDISVNTVKTHYAQSIKLLKIYMEKMIIFVWLVILFGY